MGHESVVKLLLDHGAKVNAAANHGSRALDAAARNGNELVARLLLDRGAEFKATAKNGHQNAEVKSAENYVDFCDNYGETALSLAAAVGHLDVVGVPADSGTSLETQDNEAWTLVLQAAHNNYIGVGGLALAPVFCDRSDVYRHDYQ